MSRDVVRAMIAAFVVVFRFGQHAPELLRGEEELPDLRELLDVPVSLLRRIEREAERTELILLAREDERHRHREVLVNACERHRLLEDVRALRPRWLERWLAVCDAVRVPREHLDDLLFRRPAARAVRSEISNDCGCSP